MLVLGVTDSQSAADVQVFGHPAGRVGDLPQKAHHDVNGLLVRVAILRYLVVAHPEAQAAPERAIVEVAYSLSRTLEHDDRSMAHILDALDAQGMQTLGHAVSLLTF